MNGQPEIPPLAGNVTTTRTSSSSSSSAAYPTTIGALLAEEWTINPLSTMPSFLEMILIEEARQSGYITLRSILQTLTQQLTRWGDSRHTVSSHVVIGHSDVDNNTQYNNNDRRLNSIREMDHRDADDNDDDDPELVEEEHDSSTTTELSSSIRIFSQWFQRLHQWSLNQSHCMARFVAHSILQPYGEELLFLISYTIERWSVLSLSNSATVAEGIYGTKRVKLTTTTTTSSSSSSSLSNNNKNSNNNPNSNKLQPMSKHDALRLAFCMAVGPYLSEKFDQWYRRWVPIVRRQQQQQLRRIVPNNQYHPPIIQYDHTQSRQRQKQLLLSLTKKIQHLLLGILHNRPRSWKQLFVILYPYLYMTTHGLQLIYQWRYLLGQSFFFDPISHWLGLVVRRRVILEDEENEKDNHHPQSSLSSSSLSPPSMTTTTTNNSSNPRSNTIHNPAVVPSRIVVAPHPRTGQGTILLKRVVLGILSSTLIIGFLARLYAEQNERRQQQRQATSSSVETTNAGHSNMNTAGRTTDSTTTTTTTTRNTTPNSLPPPPPPPPLCPAWKRHNKSGNGSLSSTPSNKNNVTMCPLCHQPRVHPTASTGGYVFCLKCILRYIREFGTCPITGRSCPESKIVRLYEPRASTTTSTRVINTN